MVIKCKPWRFVVIGLVIPILLVHYSFRWTPRPMDSPAIHGPTLLDETTTSTTKGKPVDIIYYDVVDPLYHLVDSGLSLDDLDFIFQDIHHTWASQTNGKIQLRFHRRTITLTPDRSFAFLIYLFGSPTIRATSKRTNLVYGNKDWVINAFEPEVSSINDALVQFGTNHTLLNTISKWLETTESYLTADQFAVLSGSLFSPLVFKGLTGDPDYTRITPESFKEFLRENQKTRSRKLYFAFRYFYLHCGIPVKRQLEILSVLEANPMMVLHYAIGRDVDLFENRVSVAQRPRWEFDNTIALFPTYYYHDLNGRGGLNWMDVIFRTASCWDQQNKVFSFRGKNFGPVQCRWGVRDHERHAYTNVEFSRLISHEIGHCLGLIHGVAQCRILPSGKEGNLMQQHRTIALQEWKNCKGLHTTDCQCPFSDVEYAQVAQARLLDADQVQTAVRFALKLDYMESDPAAGRLRIGPLISQVDYEVPLEDSGILLTVGEALELWSHTIPSTATLVTMVRIKTFFAFSPTKSLALRIFVTPKQTDCAIVRSENDDTSSVVVRIPTNLPHVEIPVSLPIAQDHMVVGLELIRKDNDEKARIRLSAVVSQEGAVNTAAVCHQHREIHTHVAINFDVI